MMERKRILSLILCLVMVVGLLPANVWAADDPSVVTVTGSVTKTVYVLTDSISANNSYLIVNSNSAGSAYALANNSGSPAAKGVTIVSGNVDGDDANETYIVLDDATDELWKVGGSYTFVNNSKYLSYTTSGNDRNKTYSLSLSSDSCSWTYSSNNDRLSVKADNNNRYLQYSSGWTISTNQDSVYFYVPTQGTVSDDVTYSITADDIDIIYTTKDETKSGTITYAVENAANGTVTYEKLNTTGSLNFTVDSSGNYTATGEGTATVRVSYQFTAVDNKSYTIYKDITVTASGTYYSVDIVARDGGDDDNGAAINAYNQLTVGDSIVNTVIVKSVTSSTVYPLWAAVYKNGSTESETVDKSLLSWSSSNTAVATVNDDGIVTFTGTDGATVITVFYEYTDLSGNKVKAIDRVNINASTSDYITPEDGTNDFPQYPNQGSVNFDKTATAIGDFSKTNLAEVELSITGIPFSKKDPIDVVLVVDLSKSMDQNSRLTYAKAASKAFVQGICVDEDGSYNDNRIAIVTFNDEDASTGDILYPASGGEYGLEKVTDLNAVNTIISNFSTETGTNYVAGFTSAQSILTTAKTDGIGNNRQQYVVFLSDGAPSNYCAVDGEEYKLSSQGTSNVSWVTNSARNSSYQYEYYTTQMKAAGVTVFTIGLGISDTQPKFLLNDMSGPAKEASQPDGSGSSNKSKLYTGELTADADFSGYYYFEVADSDAATNLKYVLEGIAKTINALAATDVAVEDVITNDYELVLTLPTDYDATGELPDGQELFIEVIQYDLDSAMERTGASESLVRIYMENGTPVAYTVSVAVDGTVTNKTVQTAAYKEVDANTGAFNLVDGAYVYVGEGKGNYDITSGVYSETADGEILMVTAYFTYDSDGYTDGTEKYAKFNWNTSEISNEHEIALRYFLLLTGNKDANNNEVPGVYATNKYATMTYTNYQGHDCQQTFPVPEMSWNGAQVTYVFYLVNDAGEPVNLEGTVVPFTQAYFVTTPVTDYVEWKSLYELESFEPQLLAEDLLPDVYELYDEGASYTIHVFETEYGSNLNNHFKIERGSDVAVNTTYVYNTISGTKYNEPGFYAATDPFWCVSDGGVEVTTDGKYTYTGEGTQATIKYTGSVSLDATEVTDEEYEYLAASGNLAAFLLIQDADAYVLSDKEGEYYLYYRNDDSTYSTIIQKDADKTVGSNFDFSNTTVAFAVKWKPNLQEDVIVVDYGMDVLFDVTANDVLINGKLVGVSNTAFGIAMDVGQSAEKLAFSDSIDLYNGTARVGAVSVQGDGASMLFEIDDSNGILLDRAYELYYVFEETFYQKTEQGDEEQVTRYMYSKVTIVPATTVYYEENFVSFGTAGDTKTIHVTGQGTVTPTFDDGGKVTSMSYTPKDDEKQVQFAEEPKGAVFFDGTYAYFQDAGGNYYTTVYGTSTSKSWETISDGKSYTSVQDTDRPGENTRYLGYDSDNIYGYDSAYLNCEMYSLGAAMKVTVDESTYATAEFIFTGTGFDLISQTGFDTGTVVVNVNGVDYFVDTFYGYESAGSEKETVEVLENDKIVEKEFTKYYGVVGSDEGALYQVPILTVRDLAYGKYTVTITVSYNEEYDHVEDSDSYDFYLDAVRIYDPTGTIASGTTTGIVAEAYIADGEWSPSYGEIRNELLSSYGQNNMFDSAVIVGSSTATGTMPENFIDSNANNTSVQDYENFGPNNELYLDGGQAIAIWVDETYLRNQSLSSDDIKGVADIQLGLKSADGGSVSVNISNYVFDSATNKYIIGKSETITLNTATDMHYSITDYFEGILVIGNEDTSAGTLSMTDIKVTLAPNANDAYYDSVDTDSSDDFKKADTDKKTALDQVLSYIADAYEAIVILVANIFSKVENWLITVTGG